MDPVQVHIVNPNNGQPVRTAPPAPTSSAAPIRTSAPGENPLQRVGDFINTHVVQPINNGIVQPIVNSPAGDIAKSIGDIAALGQGAITRNQYLKNAAAKDLGNNVGKLSPANLAKGFANSFPHYQDTSKMTPQQKAQYEQSNRLKTMNFAMGVEGGLKPVDPAAEAAAKAAAAPEQTSLFKDAQTTPQSAKAPTRSPETAPKATPTTKAPAEPLKPASSPESNAAGAAGKERKFVTSVKNSPETSPNVKELAAGKYKPLPNKTLVSNSEALVSSGLDKATDKVLGDLSQKTGKLKPQQVSDAIATAKAHDTAGNFEQASGIYNRLAEHLTALGQSVQAASLLARRSAEGILYDARKQLMQGGKGSGMEHISDILERHLQDAYQKIKATDPGSKERAYAVQDMAKIVSDNVKPGKLNQIFTLWRTGLLTGPQTVTKVIASHGVMSAAEKVKDIPAVALDKALSKFTGTRSTALTMRGTLKGAAEGTAAAKELLFHGHDTPGTSGFEKNFNELGQPTVRYGNSPAGKAANAYVDTVGHVHAAIPKPFYRAAFENDLAKQAIAEAANRGLQGAERESFIHDFTTNPSETAQNTAAQAAQMATFQQPTFLGKAASKFQEVPGFRAVAPFAHIASAILTDVKNYSPVGAVQSIAGAIKSGKADSWTPAMQKQLVEGVGRGVTGTGVIWLGSLLFAKGLITTGYPTDKKEQALWQAEGKQENSIKVGNTWRQTASLGPLGSLLAAGALWSEGQTNKANGASNAQLAAEGALQNITSQSYLSGLTEAASATQNPTEYGDSFLKLMTSSVVPTGVGTIARATDSKERTADNPVAATAAKIPGLRETLPVTQDMYGRAVPRQGGIATNILDPTRPTTATNDPVSAELQRLVNKTGTSTTPVPSAPTKISVVDPSTGKNVSMTLSKDQQRQFMSQTGQDTYKALQSVIQDPRYASLDDTTKATALAKAYADQDAVNKANYVSNTGATKGNVKLTAAEYAASQGTSPDYIQAAQLKTAGVTSSLNLNTKIDPQSKGVLVKVGSMNTTQKTQWMNDPANKYQYDLASFRNDVLNGKYDTVQQYQHQQTLGKEAITSTYPAQVNELYGMSKADLTQYLGGHPDQAATLENQLVALDNQLYSSGFVASLKFKNGVTTSGSSSSGGSSSSKIQKTTQPFGSTYTRLDTLLKATEKAGKPKAVKGGGHVALRKFSLKSSKPGNKLGRIAAGKVAAHKINQSPRAPKYQHLPGGSVSSKRIKLSV
jgi:hypothetical protein